MNFRSHTNDTLKKFDSFLFVLVLSLFLPLLFVRFCVYARPYVFTGSTESKSIDTKRCTTFGRGEQIVVQTHGRKTEKPDKTRINHSWSTAPQLIFFFFFFPLLFYHRSLPPRLFFLFTLSFWVCSTAGQLSKQLLTRPKPDINTRGLHVRRH